MADTIEAPSLDSALSTVFGGGTAPAAASPAGPSANPGLPVLQDRATTSGTIPGFQGGPPAPTNPAPGAPSQAPSAPAWDLNAWLAKVAPEAPEFAKGEKALGSWKESRSMLEAAIRENQAMALELSALREGKPVGAPDDFEKIKTEYDTLQKWKAETEPKLGELEKVRAQYDTMTNRAFRAKFDAPRADLLTSAKALAAEAGLPEDVISKVFEAKTDYAAAKALEEAKADPVAARLLGEQRAQYAKLSAAREAALAAQDPAAELAKWKQEEQALMTDVAGRAVQDLRKSFQAALPKVAESFKDPTKPENALFATAPGQAIVTRLTERLAKGEAFEPADVVRALAIAETAPAYASFAKKQAAEIASLKEQLAQLGALQPGAGAPGSGGTGTTPAANDPGAGLMAMLNRSMGGRQSDIVIPQAQAS